MTTSTSRPRGIRHRLNVGVGIAVFLTLAGTGGAQAYWSAPAQSTSGSVSAGALSATQSGFVGPNSYTSGARSFTQEIVVTNTSQVAAKPALTFSGATGQALAGGTVGTAAAGVRIWVKPPSGGCGSAPSGTPATNWNSVALPTPVPVLAAVSGAITYCVQSSMTLPLRYQIVTDGTQLSATVAADATVALGLWTSPRATATVAQSVANTITPGTPTVDAATIPTQTAIKFNWTAPSDAVGLAGYKVYRGTQLIHTVDLSVTPTPALTYTDTGLTAGTSYTYTVRGFVNGVVPGKSGTITESPSSEPLTEATKPIPVPPTSGEFYQGGYCMVTAQAGQSANFRPSFILCQPGADQRVTWNVTAIPSTTQFHIRVNGMYLSTGTFMNGNGTTNSERWTAIPIGTAFGFSSVATPSKCLQRSGLALTTANCNSATAEQQFTIGVRP